MNIMDLFTKMDYDLPLDAVMVANMDTDSGSYMLYVTHDAYTATSVAAILFVKKYYGGVNYVFTSDVDGTPRNIPFTTPTDKGNAYKLLADIVARSL